MRSATTKSILEEVTSAVFVLLLFVNFVTSMGVIVTNSTDSYDSPGSSVVAQSNTPTPTNNERHNENGQPEQPSSATQDAISRKQRQDAHIRIIRDRERWKFRLLDRVWEFLRKSSTARSHTDSIDSVDSRGSHSLSEDEEEENVRNDREHSELTTYIYLPQCSGPHNLTGEWNDSTNFRLYFKMDSLEATYRSRDTKVNSAFLYIKKKPSLVFGSHRPALTSARTARQRVTGSDAGSGSNGRAPSLRRRPTRDAETAASSSSSSPSFSRPDAGGGTINNLKIVVNSFRKNRQGSQEMRPVAVTPVSRQSTEWIRIHLTQVVDDWLKRPARNLGLQVTLRSSVLSSSSELNPDDYFEGTNCSVTAPTDRGSLDAGQSSPIHVWSSERSISQSSVDWTSAHLENITHPFLEVVTIQVPRSRPRHRRHVKPDHRFEIRGHDADRLKSSTFGKWIQSLKSSDAESSVSQTPHSSLASDSAFPLIE